MRRASSSPFGGSGPGMVAAKPLVRSFSIRQDFSESMNRYTMYGRRDTSIKHRKYGAMAIFSRFAPNIPDSLIGEEEYTGWVSLEKAGGAYNKSKTYSTLRMFYGHNRRAFNVKLFVDDVPFADDSIPASTKRATAKRWHFDKTPKKIMMIMSGEDSPNIYGLSLESDNGIAMDNISMRGSSGTLFGGIDYSSFKPMLDSLRPKLFLLQYGGNTVPYMKSAKSAERYGKDFKRQISYLKKQVPDAGFIVIGPADMSKKVKGKLQTYPWLEEVRDALKKAAFESGAAYFDVFEVMGGRNSMIQWVEAEQPLAGKDYVHFNPKGAKLIAEKFVESFFEDYEEYVKGRVQ
ncbi:MAG: GDSL-type esterase/lipase family protein [Bacteroidota bacterium]